MTRSEVREYLELRKQPLIRKKADRLRFWELGQMYLEEKMESLYKYHTIKNMIESVEKICNSEDRTELKEACGDVIKYVTDGDSLTITGLNLNTYDKLMAFIEKEIHPFVTDQTTHLF